MIEKKYTPDGYLVVSEFDRCSFFEQGEAASQPCCGDDCFFCKFSDFRKQEYIEKVKTDARHGVLYSVCHNEKNKKAI